MPDRIVVAATMVLLTGCAHAANDLQKPVPDDVAVMLIVQNSTPREVAVYFIDQTSHVRLGRAAGNSEARLPVRRVLLNGRTSFRVYAFRGQEPCPVARVLELDTTRISRITVTRADTVVSAYLAGDACHAKRR